MPESSVPTIATVRVFVPTYRRPQLLLRALNSLLAQTFQSWVCEVHNDDPEDARPAELLALLDDERIKLHQHERNLGGAATFNLFYRATNEAFYALLEDDNWWEPTFLETMVSAMRRYPTVTLAWCAQKIWQEISDDQLPTRWRDTGIVAATVESCAERLVYFGDHKQALGALHANGSMLIRSRAGEAYPTPSTWPFVAIEPFRERMIPHPLLFIPAPLCNFSKTLETERKESRAEWMTVQTILAATFMTQTPYPKELFAHARSQQPPATNGLLLGAVMEPTCWQKLRHSKLRDWVILVRGLIRSPDVLWHVLASKRDHPDWWQLLHRHTAERFLESNKWSVGSAPQISANDTADRRPI
jgi:hypothetical protein